MCVAFYTRNWLPDFPYFTQEYFFHSVDPQVANAARVSKEGMTLDQLDAALKQFPIDVKKFHSGDLTLAQFRDLIRDTSGRSDRFALLNFRRMEIGEVGGGHWSPLTAFDAASDSALVLDVARYKYPTVWVPIAKLYAGSQAVDKVSGLSRGLVIAVGRCAKISRRSCCLTAQISTRPRWISTKTPACERVFAVRRFL
jgi:Phytochelatin synthase